MTLRHLLLAPLSFLLLALVSCTSLSAFDADLAAGTAALVPAANLACESATVLDPSGATALCTAIDATGAAVGATITVIEDAVSIAALLTRTAPKIPATKVLLENELARRVGAKIAGGK